MTKLRSSGSRLAVVGALPVMLIALAATASGEPACPLDGALGGSGVVIASAAADSPVIAEAAARLVALDHVPRGLVAEAALGRVSDDTQRTIRDRLAWAVALQAVRVGSNGPADAVDTATTLCTAVFIDATSGDFLFGLQYGISP